MDPQLVSLSVPAEELANIEECLGQMQAELNATSIMLLDGSGQVIASHTRRGAPEEAIVGALLAGTFASSRELARVLKDQEFKTLIQQGPTENIYAELILNQWILAVIFRKHTLLGLVRVVVKQQVAALETIYKRVRANSRSRDRLLSESLRDSIKDSFDRLFGDFENEALRQAN